jgi:hypothetical protein
MRTGGRQNGLTGKAVSERFFFQILSVFQQCNNIGVFPGASVFWAAPLNMSAR